MSLIHDALKRAEEDKLSNTPPGEAAGAVLPLSPGPVPSSPPPPAPAVIRVSDRLKKLPATLILATVITLGIGAAVSWHLGAGGDEPVSPSAAPGAVADAALPSTPAAPAAEAPPARPAGAAARAPAPQATGETSGAPQPGAPTVIRAEPSAEPSPPAGERKPERVAHFTVISPATDVTPVVAGAAGPAPDPAAGDASPTLAAAGPELGHPVPPAGTTAPEPARFKLSYVIRTGDGAAATINGRLLHVGDSIDGATVVEIGSRSVEMEYAGQRFTVGM